MATSAGRKRHQIEGLLEQSTYFHSFATLLVFLVLFTAGAIADDQLLLTFDHPDSLQWWTFEDLDLEAGQLPLGEVLWTEDGNPGGGLLISKTVAGLGVTFASSPCFSGLDEQSLIVQTDALGTNTGRDCAIAIYAYPKASCVGEPAVSWGDSGRVDVWERFGTGILPQPQRPSYRVVLWLIANSTGTCTFDNVEIRGPGLVEIPTLSNAGSLALAAAIAIVALVLARRHGAT